MDACSCGGETGKPIGGASVTGSSIETIASPPRREEPGTAGSSSGTVFEIVAELSHAVGTTLTIVRNNLELVNAEIGRTRDPSAAVEALGLVGARSSEATSSLDRLSKLLRAFRHGLGPHPGALFEPLRLDLVVREGLDALAAGARRRNVALEADFAPTAPLLLDGDAVRRLLTHLVSNALDASPPGARVLVRVRDLEGGGALVVEDEGPGVPPETAGSCYEPFVTSKEGALGMGLTFARALVELHGGRLTHETRREGGARFVATFPRTAPRAGASSAPASHSRNIHGDHVGDIRFEEAWVEWEKVAPGDRPSPESALFLKKASDDVLIALLSSEASHTRPISRNIIATELTTRMQRHTERTPSASAARALDLAEASRKLATKTNRIVAESEALSRYRERNARRRVHAPEPDGSGGSDDERATGRDRRDADA